MHSRITQKADFICVHNSYAPGSWNGSNGANAATAYRALMAAPEDVRDNLNQLMNDIQRYALPQNAGMKIAVTEPGSTWLIPPSAKDPAQMLACTQENFTWRSALTRFDSC